METEKNAGPNHLRAWREFNEMTLADLAEKAGTTESVIWLLEEGRRGLSAKWLRRLAPILGTTPGFLLDHDPNDLDNRFHEAVKDIPLDRRDLALQVLESFKTGTRG